MDDNRPNTETREVHATPHQRDPGDTGSTGGAWRLAHLLDGYITTQLLYVAASLGIAELLADGPLSAAQIAAEVDADPSMLTRVCGAWQPRT